jgi:hypothetical protein
MTDVVSLWAIPRKIAVDDFDNYPVTIEHMT